MFLRLWGLQQRVWQVLALAHAGLHRGSWVRRRADLPPRACVQFLAFGIGALTLGFALTGCAVGPNYSREAAPVPTQYKEIKGWKRANPSDDVDRGDWWKVYRDRGLDALLPQVEISNQTVAADAAAYEEAKAIIREGQSALFPIATAGYQMTRTRTGARAGTTGGLSLIHI